MKCKFLLFIFLICSSLFPLNIEKSEAKFFPKQLGEKLLLFKSFETFWWGFVVTDRESGHEVCGILKKSELFQRVECEQSPSDYQKLLKDWARDLPLRAPPPPHLREKFLQGLGKASLPMPPEVFSALRTDPLGSYEELVAIFKSRLSLPFERVGGIFTDKETNRAIIPLQPNFPPGESEKLEALKQQLGAKAHFIGPHASTMENKGQITVDLKWVSILGTLSTLLFVGLLLFLRQFKLSILLIPAFAATGLSAWTVNFLFGSVHGLTLCFGSGIIGFAVDYGLQAAFHPHSKQVWRSNFSGCITTLLCLFVISFSKIPLLHELMVFSIFGVVYAYLLYFLFRHKISNHLVGKKYGIPIRGNKAANLLSIILFVCLVVGLFKLKPAFELKQFDFQSPATKELSTWLYPKIMKAPPFFLVHEGTLDTVLEKSHALMDWGKQKGFLFETIGLYLPEKGVREKNIAEWKERECDKNNLAKLLTKEEKMLFSSIVEEWSCASLAQKNEIIKIPEYLRPLTYKNSYLTLWFPRSKADEAEIRGQFPESLPLSELTVQFSKILGNEVIWMLPVAITLILLYLLLYYKSFFLACCGLIPFFMGSGAIAFAGLFFSLPLSFMTFMAVIMLLGLSVDYGVFAIDAIKVLHTKEEVYKTSTGMLFSALTTLLGFFPLLGCKHQILFQLGAALSLGVLGTVVGAYFTIPAILKRGKD